MVNSFPVPTRSLPNTPGGRLSVTSAAAVLSGNATAQGTIYYVPFDNATVPVWNGTGWELFSTGSQLSLALDTASGHTGYQQSGKLFDIFAYMKAGVLTLGTGPAWTNLTTRASALSLKDGLNTNNASITLKFDTSASTSTVAANQATYLGTMYATADGKTGVNIKPTAASGGGANIIGIWNAYNRVPLKAISMDSGAGYTYAVNTWQKANNNANNSISWVDGLAQTSVLAHLEIAAGTATVGAAVNTGINLNSQSAVPNVWGYAASAINAVADDYQMVSVREAFLPVQGFNYVQAMEKSPSAVTATFNPGGNTQSLALDLDY